MKTTPLDRFLRFLDQQTAATFRGDAVDRYLAENPVDSDEFHPFIYFREDTYGRNLVHRTDHCELMVLTWLPGHRTPIHDHGGQRCWMLMHTGALTFKSFGPIVSEKTLPPPVGEAVTHKAGQSVYIDDDMGVHSIANATQKPAVSIHLYAGPIPRCRIYDEKTKQFAWIDLKYFTEFGREVSNRSGNRRSPEAAPH